MNVAPLGARLPRGSVTSLVDLPEYIVTTFIPGARPLLDRYPRLFRLLGILVAFYYFGPVSRLRDLWSQCSSLLVSSVQVNSDEDLFNYLTSFLAKKPAVRPNQSLHAITNPIQESRRHRHDPEYVEKAHGGARHKPQVKYEQGKGLQIFIHDRRIFWVQRAEGEGHNYYGNRYKRQEVFTFSCLGRSTQPIKDMLEGVYRKHKEKEKSLTVIRRPYGGGYGSRLSWSRLTAKRRRQLDTVILQESQTSAVLADMEEYMSEATKTFYANHGIPYRRGYLFHGPPGCGKTSFCLALASRFDLDVYILTLLDKDITDTDLMSLLNQLPTPSLLLLEDIDEAGLNRKGKPLSSRNRNRPRNRRGTKGAPEGVVSAEDGNNSDEEDDGPRTQVTLSGLLNAIDGVAAPEGHILIMTTNKPYELDDALVRAGRISVRVEFSNATPKQAEQIFLRMYVDLDETASATSTVLSPTEPKQAVAADLTALASTFGAALPEDTFSPADLQDYLLIHKKDPAGAVASFAAWIDANLEERQRKEEEKEQELRYKAERAEEKRKKWQEDLKKALKENEAEGMEKMSKMEKMAQVKKEETNTQDAKDVKEENPSASN